MKRLVLILSLLATPAFADTVPIDRADVQAVLQLLPSVQITGAQAPALINLAHRLEAALAPPAEKKEPKP